MGSIFISVRKALKNVGILVVAAVGASLLSPELAAAVSDTGLLAPIMIILLNSLGNIIADQAKHWGEEPPVPE